MAIRWKKLYKKYERIILLAIVIILIAMFSVTGALTGCEEQGSASRFELGGSFNVSPTERETLTNTDFDREFQRYSDFVNACRMPSLEYQDHLMYRMQSDPFVRTWNHIILRDAALNAGYRVGRNTTKAAARDAVNAEIRMPVNDVNFQEFLDNRYRGRPADFMDEAKALALKDAFMTPIVDTSRYAETYAEAFETWKLDRQRVNLEYVVLPAAPFADIVEKEERARSIISEREAALRQVTTATTMIRSVMVSLEALRGEAEAEAKAKAKDAGEDEPADDPSWWPESLDVLVEKKRLMSPPVDPWGNALRYAVSDAGDVDLRSAGVDGEFDTADDITLAFQKQLVTHGNLKDMARVVLEWRGGRGEWPAELADVLKPAKEGGVAPLRRLKKDGFDRDFAYETTADGAVLIALGPDGERGSDDDVPFALDVETKPAAVTIPLGPGLLTIVGASEPDPWGSPLVVYLDGAQPIQWRVTSAGPDGEAGTDDDIEGGNEQQLRDYFSQPDVRDRYRLPVRRQFEALYVHLPLLPDSILAKLWEAFPDQRPASEEQLYQSWLAYRGDDLIYRADDPGDENDGHGAAYAREIAPDATLYLIPDKDGTIFPESLDEDAVARNKDENGDAEPNDGDDEKDDDGEEVIDPERKTYEESGWRNVMIRQRFVENVLAFLLHRAVESEKAIEEWEAEFGDEPESAPIVRPERVTFESLLANELNPFLLGAADQDKGVQTFGYFITEKPEGTPEDAEEWGLTREQWEADPHVGDDNVTVFLSSQTGAGGYVRNPVQIRQRTTKALVRNIEYLPARDRQLDEVRDEVFQEYLQKRQMDRAVAELVKLKEAAPVPTGDKTVDEIEPEWQATLEAWGDAHGLPYRVEQSGMYIGSTPPLPVEVDNGDESDEAAETRRRNFIWRMGYDSVRPTESRQDTSTGEPGTFGRSPLPDEKRRDEGGTGAAYLVRVRERAFPTPYEFSPRRYADYLSEVAFATDATRLSDLKGTFYQALSRFMGDPDVLIGKWKLETNSPLQKLE